MVCGAQTLLDSRANNFSAQFHLHKNADMHNYFALCLRHLF